MCKTWWILFQIKSNLVHKQFDKQSMKSEKVAEASEKRLQNERGEKK